MNITPKQLKPRCVLEGAKFIGKTKWGPPDLPHPIKKRHCKAFVVNNRVQIFNNNQIRKCTNLTHLVDYDWWGESLSFAKIKAAPAWKENTSLARAIFFWKSCNTALYKGERCP
jgi:hypothetical protein